MRQFSLLSLLAAGFLSGRAAASLQPVDLHCESTANPVGVDSPQPRLSWKLESADRGARQSAYQVLVATSADLLRHNQGDLWDSGTVESPETIAVRYAGKPFHSSQPAFWKVRVWDRHRKESSWSDASSWVMGMLSPQDWHSSWIALRAGKVIPGEGLPIFRKAFALEKPVVRAIVHICGLGQFDLFLDGRRVGEHFLDPAWSVYEKTAYYVSFDITAALVEPGRHAFGIMLGKGFYNTSGDRRVHGVNADRPLKLILQAEVTFADGSREVIGSDDSWKATAGPITHSAILGGEDFDARRLPPGWDQASFDDSTWANATVTAGPGGALVASLAPPMKAHEIFQPARINEPEPGVFVYDFGQNASAVPRLRVRGQAGQKIKLTPAEQRRGMTPRRNDGRGLVNPAGVGKPNHFEYTLRGGVSEAWTPQFSYTGFQYLQLEGAVPADHPNPDQKPVLEELLAVHVRNDATSVGRFECSNPLLNRIDRLVDWAVRSNLGHVLTDCPHREKLGWLEVAYLMGPSIAGRYDISRFYAKIARDIADSQGATGLVPTVAPAYPAFDGGFAYTPEWGAAAVIVPWLVYEWYGDRGTLETSYPSMKRFADYLRSTSKDLVPVAGLGDWYDYGHGKPVGASQFTPIELSAMATFRRCASVVANAAQVLGREEEAARYAKLAGQLGEAFNRRWFDGTNEFQNLGSPQTGSSMALVTGMVAPDRKRAVLQRMIEDIQARGNQQTAGDIGHWYLLQALAENGRSDVIFDLAARTNLGSYGYIVDSGWTSMPEAWDADTGASMNHCMLGHIQEWLLGWIAGIRPESTAPGFSRFVIDPHPVGDLAWARGEFDSIRGRIVSAWEIVDGRFALHLVVPANTEAVLHLPVPAGGAVMEGGKPVAGASGIRQLSAEPDRAGRQSFIVEGGHYRFEVSGVTPPPR